MFHCLLFDIYFLPDGEFDGTDRRRVPTKKAGVSDETRHFFTSRPKAPRSQIHNTMTRLHNLVALVVRSSSHPSDAPARRAPACSRRVPLERSKGKTSLGTAAAAATPPTFPLKTGKDTSTPIV
jgi:hypothetical protein